MNRAYSWHQDNQIYFLLFTKLLAADERPQAMRLLSRISPLIMPCDNVTQYLSDEELFDLDMQAYYRNALVEKQKIEKELKILRGMTAQKYLQVAEELMRIKVLGRVVISEETCCEGCQKLIGTDPFKYEYST